VLIIPAIDILNGSTVRLYMGDYDSVEVYDTNPVDMARKFEEAGAKRLHIVDLNAARTGSHDNRMVIRKIRRSFSGTIEVGGGIRTREDVEHLIEIGVDRMVLGTVLVKDPKLVSEWISQFGPRFIGGIDALRGEVKIHGWEEGSSLSDIVLAKKCKELGLVSIIYTNISRDGTLEGPDVERTARIAEESGLPVILSGGISSEGDIAAISEGLYPGIKGVITGKAIYKNKIDLAACIAKYQRAQDSEGILW